MTQEYIDLLIAWGPTLLFFIMVVWSTIVGMLRGLRKSRIFFIHSIIGLTICISLYFAFINVEALDVALLQIINTFGGSKTFLQDLFQVSASCKSVKEVLVEFIPSLFSFEDSIALIVKDNGAYLLTLVNMAYHLVFAIILYVVYLLLLFIMYLIYLLAYSNMKFKKKMKRKVALNKTNYTYKKRSLLGGLIGLFRGIVAGLVVLSLLGSSFYIITGSNGDGNNVTEGVDFGSDQYNQMYGVYHSMESYGSSGIFKVLNAFHDKENTPYYLFVADIVFSGGFVDEETNVSTNVSLREELANFTNFGKNAFALIMKYGGEEIRSIILNGSNENTMDIVIHVMKSGEFNTEFKQLINKFEDSFILNFTLSAVDSIVNHIDEVSFADGLTEDAKDLIKVLFKKGYHSPSIEEENKDATDKVYPYIKPSQLLKKSDVFVAYDIVCEILTTNFEAEGKDSLDMVKQFVPYAKKLSILGDKTRVDEINPVLQRVYLYAENKYLSGSLPVTEDVLDYDALKVDTTISWIDELNKLLDITDNLIGLIRNIYVVPASGETPDILHYIMDVFNEENVNYTENIKMYDSICGTLENSKILGRVLSTNFIYQTIEESLKSISENIYVSKSIAYDNKYDKEGKLLKHGEAYNLLTGLKFLCNSENIDLIDNLLDTSTTPDFTEILELISDKIENIDENGMHLYDYLMDSDILHSIISSFLIDYSNGPDAFLYIPNSSYVKNQKDQVINLVNKDQLKNILINANSIIGLIKPIMTDPNNMENITAILQDKSLVQLLDNPILEGSVSKIVLSQIKSNPDISIPNELNNVENWLTTSTVKGEIKCLISGVQESGLDIGALLDNSLTEDQMIKTIQEIDSDAIDELLNSKILHYTISSYLVKGFSTDAFEVIVPKAALDTSFKEDVIAKTEIKQLLASFSLLNLNEGEIDVATTISSLVKNKDTVLSGNILSASFIYSLVNKGLLTDDVKEIVSIPDTLKADATKEKLLNFQSQSTTTSNLWNNELSSFLDAFNELFDIENNEDFTLDESTITPLLESTLKTINDPSTINPDKTKLDVLFDSIIISNSVSKTLDTYVTQMVSTDIANSIKDKNGNYTKAEIGNLLEALGVLDISLTETIDTSELVNSVINLSNDEIETIYASSLAKYIVTDQLQQIIVSNNLLASSEEDSNGILASLKVNEINTSNYKYFSVLEIENLLSAVKTLEIDLTNGDTSSVMNKVTSLTDEDISKLYSSHIIKFVISYQITNALIDANVLPKATIDSIKVNTIAPTSSYRYFKQEEIRNVLTAFDTLHINVENPEMDGIIGTISELSEDDINTIYASDLAKYIISNNLSTTLIDQNILSSGIINSLKVNELNHSSYKYFPSSEIVNLLHSFTLLNVDLENPDFSNIITTILDLQDSQVSEVYQSNIVKYVMTNTIQDALNEDEELNFIKINEINTSGYTYIKEQEILNFFNAIQTIYEGETFDLENIDESIINKFSDSSKLDAVYNSVIVVSIITNTIVNTIADSPMLQDHPKAYDEHQLLIQSEVQALVDFIGTKTLSEIDVTTISIEDLDAALFDANGNTKSYLVISTISKNILNVDILAVPAVDMDTTITSVRTLKGEAIHQIFDALEALGISSLTFDASSIKVPTDEQKQNDFAASATIRATLTKNLVITNGSEAQDIFASEDSIENTVDAVNVPLLVISETEMKNLMKAICAINPSGSLNVTMNTATILRIYLQGDVIFNSDIIYISISKTMKDNYGAALSLVGATYSSVSGYNISQKTHLDAIEKINNLPIIINAIATFMV